MLDKKQKDKLLKFLKEKGSNDRSVIFMSDYLIIRDCLEKAEKIDSSVHALSTTYRKDLKLKNLLEHAFNWEWICVKNNKEYFEDLSCRIKKEIESNKPKKTIL